MASVPPPQGLNEADYETIEAAVTETVRGRWFLNEFARRHRSGEMRQILDAMGRLEASVVSSQAALPSADPSVRLLIQRIKDVAGQLETLSQDMQAAGVDERFAEAVALQARAVSGMMRGPAPGKPPAGREPQLPQPVAKLPRADLPPGLMARPEAAPVPNRSEQSRAPAGDPRLAALSGLDSLPLAKKLSVFS